MNLDELALVHLTGQKPERLGSDLHLSTTYHHRQASGASPYETDAMGHTALRQTVHFTLQEAVTDHTYGKFEGRSWAVVAPLASSLQANGRPETVLSSDIAFFPEHGAMRLPGAVLVEFTSDLPADVFIAKTDAGDLQVSRALTHENLAQAQSFFQDLAAQGHDVAAECRLLLKGDALATREITALGVSAAVAGMGLPTASAMTGQAPGASLGWDGWMTASEHRVLKDAIEAVTPAGDMGEIKVSRHAGSAGDRLFDAVTQTHLSDVEAIARDTGAPARIRAAAAAWCVDPHFAQVRADRICQELRHGPAYITRPTGEDAPGIVCALFSDTKSPFQHPTLGPVTSEEVHAVLQNMGPAKRNELLTETLSRRVGEDLPSFYQNFADELASLGATPTNGPVYVDPKQDMPPPSFAFGSAQAGQSMCFAAHGIAMPPPQPYDGPQPPPLAMTP